MTLTPVTSVIQVAAPPPARVPVYALRLACGHTVRRGFRDGPIPKRVVCRECAA